ncbi:meiotic recombination protein SPO11-2 isoform X4 [Cucurbita moschata]|uniref:Meiotic recombination protein SPO11-2 isoform X4 n=1 Tax=Cucurbita moschata TaxID=3662 RepID=A0A6J1H3H5_CUCMO|nr:meiotic recombination protein SPO11-2 isoform X4 [Cucurbita moschata]
METTGLFKSSMRFFSDQELCYADILTPQEVLARIQVAVLNFLRILSSSTPAISNLPLIDRSSSNSRVNQGILTDESWIFLSHSFCTRSLMRANAAKAFVRVWKLMEMCSQILLQEKRVTQRELFYKLFCDSPAYFPTQLHVNRTIQDVVALLRCSRFSLGVMASSRGLVAGRLLLQEPEQETVDCAACGTSGYAISGDLDLLQKLTLKTDARMPSSSGWRRIEFSITFPVFLSLPKDIQTWQQGIFFTESAKRFPTCQFSALLIGMILFNINSATDCRIIFSCLASGVLKEPCWVGYIMYLQVWKYRDGLRGIQIRHARRRCTTYTTRIFGFTQAPGPTNCQKLDVLGNITGELSRRADLDG